MFANVVSTDRIHKPLVLLVFPGVQHVVADHIEETRKPKAAMESTGHTDECFEEDQSSEIG